MLLAVPDGAFTADELEVGAVGAEIPDLPRSFAGCRHRGQVHIRWPEGTIHFVVKGQLARLDVEKLCAFSQAWVEEGSVRDSDH